MEHQKSTVNGEIINKEQDGNLIVIELNFGQEVLIASSFIISGFLLLLLTEPGMNLLPPSPFIEILTLLRAIVNSILLLFIPGFALTNLLFRDYTKLDFIERIALACGLSISIIIIAGFILASGEINAFSIFLIITAFTTVFLAIKLLLIRYIDDSSIKSGKDRLFTALRSKNWLKTVNFPRTVNLSDIRVKDWKHKPPITGLIEYYSIKSHYITLLYTATISIFALMITLFFAPEINNNNLLVVLTTITVFFLFFAEFLHLSNHIVRPVLIIFLITLIFILLAWFLVILLVTVVNFLLPDISLDFNLVFIICILVIYEIEIAQVYFHMEDAEENNDITESNVS